jgi:hypothetical protein
MREAPRLCEGTEGVQVDIPAGERNVQLDSERPHASQREAWGTRKFYGGSLDHPPRNQGVL